METLNRQDQTMVHLTINNIPCCAPAGSTILEAAHAAGIAIPTLCYLKEVNEIGACRMCVVEVRGGAQSGARLCPSHCRGNGGIYQHQKCSGGPPNQSEAFVVHT